nr:ribonuclease H-like domain-containing protein [Tanacetum cinerariifolium]
MTRLKYNALTVIRWDILIVNVKDTSSKAMVEIDGAGFDWSYMDDEAPTNMAFMAFLHSKVYTDNTCSKTYLKNYATLKTQYDELRVEFNKSKCNLANYKKGLTSIEEQLVHYKKNESLLNENIAVLKRDILIKDSEIAVLENKLEKISKDEDDLDNKIKKFENASQRLENLIGSQITDKSKRGLGYVSYNAVLPLHAGRLGENTIRGTGWPVNLKSTRRSFQRRTSYNNRNFSQKVNTAKGKVNTARLNSAVLNAVRENKGKASLMEDMLHLGDELKVMCDKKNNVLFSDTECFVLSLDFMLADESYVLLKVPRKSNMYSVDMKNTVPTKDLTCLISKATNDESMLWHRRLGHINFKNINKLVKENLF